MTIYEIVSKIIGPTGALGETNEDQERLVNLNVKIHLINELIEDILQSAKDKSRQEHSMREIGSTAHSFLISLYQELEEYMEEL